MNALNTTRRQLVPLAMALASLTMAGHTRAADFPSHAVRIIVSFTPGAAPDIVARALADALTKKWGVPAIVENKMGAEGVIASDTVARAAPDGHTLYLATMGNIALLPATVEKLPYDAATSFRGVSFVAGNPFAILLSNGSPVKSVDELVQLSKKRQLTYGSAGTLGPLIGAQLVKQTGADLTYVPYRGAQPALIDLAGGQIDMVIADLPSLLPTQQQGRGKILTVTAKSRSSLAPEVPTMVEAGFKDFNFSTWYSVVVPAKTPNAIVEKLNADVTEALANPDVVKRLLTLGMTPQPSTSKAMDEIMKHDLALWARVVKDK